MSTIYSFDLPLLPLVVIGSFSFVGYLTVCLFSWYTIQGFSYGMSGGQLGRHWLLFPFQCFLEDLPCYLPNGKVHREKFIRDRVGDWDGVMIGYSRSYSHEEIRRGNLYEEVFYEMKGSMFSFWLGHLTCFFFGPVMIPLLITLILAHWVLYFFVMFIPKSLR